MFCSNIQRIHKIKNIANVDLTSQQQDVELEVLESKLEYRYLCEPVQTKHDKVLCSEWEDRYSSSSSKEEEKQEGIANEG